MPQVSRIEGVDRVIKRLRAEARKQQKEVNVIVGFTVAYAVHVHENTHAAHKVGQAKFLETPARQNAKEIGTIIRKAFEKTKDLEKSVLLGGLFLQRESQKLAPVDTGALKNSAFTAPQRNVEQAATEAFRKAEAIRKKAKSRNK